MPSLMIRPTRAPLAISSKQTLDEATRRARALADRATLNQFSRRLQQLEDLVGKLAFALQEISGSRAPRSGRR